jgi:cysteine desulfurase
MKRLAALRDALAAALFDQLTDLELCGPALDGRNANGLPRRLPGNLNVSFGNVDGEALLLAMGNLAVSSGAACTSTDPGPSHVLRALGFSEDAARSSLRFGLGRFNTQSDVDFTIERVVQAVQRLRKLTSWPATAETGH